MGMRILFDVGHPTHVHVFKNVIRILSERGHKCFVTTREKECTLELLGELGLEYTSLGNHSSGMGGKLLKLFYFDLKLLRTAWRFRPHLVVSKGSPYAAHVSRLLGVPHVAFKDTEDARLNDLLALPFTSAVVTPECFLRELGEKHHRFNGIFQLAYLHPRYFSPEREVLGELGLSEEDRFCVLRFISWGAAHDAGLAGITPEFAERILETLRGYGEVFVSSERKLPPAFEKHRLSLHPSKFHSLLYYADLYLGEGGSTALEAAVLGTPSVHVEKVLSGAVAAASVNSGVFRELRDRYGLVYMYEEQEEALGKAVEILENPDSKAEWREKRERLLRDKVDVAEWMAGFIEGYAERDGGGG
jgi:hypothetical protein